MACRTFNCPSAGIGPQFMNGIMTNVMGGRLLAPSVLLLMPLLPVACSSIGPQLFNYLLGNFPRFFNGH
jgi:hypothetical protein